MVRVQVRDRALNRVRLLVRVRHELLRLRSGRLQLRRNRVQVRVVLFNLVRRFEEFLVRLFCRNLVR